MVIRLATQKCRSANSMTKVPRYAGNVLLFCGSPSGVSSSPSPCGWPPFTVVLPRGLVPFAERRSGEEEEGNRRAGGRTREKRPFRSGETRRRRTEQEKGEWGSDTYFAACNDAAKKALELAFFALAGLTSVQGRGNGKRVWDRMQKGRQQK